MRHWYRTFFNDNALDTWQDSRSEELTAREVDYLERTLELAGRDARLIDLACGNGRHAVGLAARGHAVTGVDVTLANRERAHARAAARGVAIDFVVADMSELDVGGSFEGAYCWGNSLGYFPRPQMHTLFAGVSRALVPGARFAIETAMTAESILTGLNRRPWVRTDEDTRIMLECTYDARESRLDTVYTTLVGDRVVDTSTAHNWIFTTGELVAMAEDAGFDPVALHCDLEGGEFEPGAGRLILVVARR